MIKYIFPGPGKLVEDEKMDKKIICKDCGKEFILTIGEQEWYKEKGFNDPVRCKECRQARKLEKK